MIRKIARFLTSEHRIGEPYTWKKEFHYEVMGSNLHLYQRKPEVHYALDYLRSARLEEVLGLSVILKSEIDESEWEKFLVHFEEALPEICKVWPRKGKDSIQYRLIDVQESGKTIEGIVHS